MRSPLKTGITIIYWLLVCGFALCATLILAAKMLLPHINDYRSQIESNLSQLTGYQVTLDSIDGRLEGIDPTVSANNFLISINGQPAVHVPEIRIRLNAWHSLLSLSPQFTYVRFVQPNLALDERNGQWRLKGAPPSTNVKSDVGVERILGYLTAQRSFSVLNAKVELNSQQYGKHSIAVPSAYIFQQAQSSWIKSQIYLDGNATPFDVNAKIYHSYGAFGAYQVDASVNVPNVLVAFDEKSHTWAKGLSSTDFAGKLWLNYRVGEGFVVQAKASKLSVAFKNGEQYHSSPDIRVRYNQKKAGLSVDVHNLAIGTDQNKTYPETNVSYEWSAATGQSYVAFDHFDLALAHRIAGHFLQPEWQITQLLTGLSPQGEMTNASLRLGIKDDQVSYHFLSNLEDVSASAYQGIPKANHVNAIFNTTQNGGYIQFKQHQGELAFPELYQKSWALSGLSGVVDWKLVQNTFVVSGRNLEAKRHGAVIDGGFRYESRPDSPNWISLSLGVKNLPVTDRLTYVPDKVLGSELREWLDQAFADKGEVTSGDLLIQSELVDNATPDVRLKLAVRDAEVQFNKDWPLATGVNGELLYDASGVHVSVNSANLADLPVSDVKIEVPVDHGVADWLTVAANMSQDASDVFRILRTTPLADSVLLPFKSWRISGPLAGHFKVAIPLNDNNPEPTLDLGLNFKNNPLYIGDINLSSTVDKGQLNYSSSKGIFDSNFEVQSFSGHSKLTLSSAQEKDGRISVFGDMSGTADVRQIAKWRGLPDSIGDKVKGVVPYTGKLTINKAQQGQVDLLINSDLKGGEVDLPAPFNKVPNSVMTTQINVMAHDQDILLKVNIASLLNSRVLISSGEFVGGELFFDSGKSFPKEMKKGLLLGGQIGAVNVSAWEDVFKQVTDSSSSSTQLTDANFSLPTWLYRVNLLFDKVVVNPQNTLHNLKLSYDEKITKGKLEASSDELNFKYDVYQNKPRLHFGYLNWNTSDSSADEGADSPPFHASQVPDILLSVDQLYLNQKPYGDWVLNVTREGDVVRIEPFSSSLKKGTFDGHLIWRDTPQHPGVKLTLAVKGNDLAELIGKFSDKAFLSSDSYTINVALNWDGHPFYFDRKSLYGKISFDAKEGNFSTVDELPAFMKIFGVFNVEALKRRLSLDFSDVYKPGLTYDSLKGTFDIKQGILKTTKPLTVSSPTAEVSLEGTADIVNETLNETLTAVLPITRSLPLAGLLWGTPQLAGILYLTDKLIGDTLSKVTSAQYKIEGPFDSPVVTPIKHQAVKAKRAER